ncbi:MAG: cytochrome c biogenesis protein CcdA [Saprospiraceae bacterium]
MKFIQAILLFILISLSTQSFAQILNPVKWTMDNKQIAGNEYELKFTAKIEKGWTVYSQFTADDGPVPTELVFENIEGAKLIGKATEQGHKKEGLDKLFDVNVIKFLADEDFVMTQKIKIKDYSKPITGYLTFMTCNNKTCLPPTDVDFSFNIKKNLTSSSVPTNIGGSDNTNTKKSGSAHSNQQPNNKTTSTDNIKVVTVPTKSPSKTSIPTKIASVKKAQPTSTINNVDKKKILKPVTWNITKTKMSDNEYMLTYTANIADGWGVYSIYMDEGGPVPTTITYEKMDGIELVGKATEKGHKKEGKDPLFDEVESVIKFLDDKDYIIEQTIKVKDGSKPVSGYLNYMTCNDKGCLPPTDVDFSFDFSGIGSTASTLPDDIISKAGSNGKFDQSRPTIKATVGNPLSNCGSALTKTDSSLLWLLVAGLLGGFAALMTPCVFPMIPITVSFFTKDTKRKGWVNGVIYGISIIVIYVILGLLITVFMGPETLQALATNWIANTIFFIIFIVFAFSFFGFYEITLPSSWSTKSDRMADKGGLIGIFFMAATLALVSFSCTGPIVGSALVAAAKGGIAGPLVVMLGFSTALALPFGLFAAFPAWLNSLPKSGGWMNSVKVVLGFLEVGFAFKFLSTADLTQHWGILKYETFMLIFILVFLAIAAYLFGFIKFPHDSPIKKLSLVRKTLATGFLALAVYLGFGFTINKDTGIYNSLWLTSGFSPPVMYNMFLDKSDVDPKLKKKYPSLTKCANNIDCFKDYYEGMAYAKEIGKPAFLDFTGHGCQNCRRTEDNIWVNDKIRQMLNDDVVLISLYTDDREKLKTAYTSLLDGKKKRTVGAQWADFEVTNFAQNSQPLYIMMTPDEKVITNPRGYEENVKSYKEYLDCGLKFFNEMKK